MALLDKYLRDVIVASTQPRLFRRGNIRSPGLANQCEESFNSAVPTKHGYDYSIVKDRYAPAVISRPLSPNPSRRAFIATTGTPIGAILAAARASITGSGVSHM